MENKKIILGLTGNISSGKGTVTKYLTEKYQANSYRFSTILRDVLERLYCETTRENLQLISTVLRKNFGEDVLSKVIAEDVAKDNNKIIVIDGIRREADIKYLQKMEGFKLARIIADSKTRYERLIARNENKNDNQKTYEQFLEDHKKESDSEVPLIMNQAEIEINNNGNFEELYRQIDSIIQSK